MLNDDDDLDHDSDYYYFPIDNNYDEDPVVDSTDDRRIC